MVIAPLSTLPHWQREIEAWTDLNAVLFHGDSFSRELIFEHELHYRTERNVKIRKPLKFNVLLTTPEMGAASAPHVLRVASSLSYIFTLFHVEFRVLMVFIIIFCILS